VPRSRPEFAYDPAAFAALEREVLELLWSHNPIYASLLGLEKYDACLPPIGADGRSEFCWKAADLLQRLERLPQPAPHEAGARAEHWALSSLLRVPRAIEEQFSPCTRNPVLLLENLLQGIYLLMQRPGALDPKRAAALVARLEAAPTYLAEARHNLHPHAARVPLAWAEIALRQVPGGESMIRQACERVAREQTDLGAAAEAAALAALAALAEFAELLRRDILPRARGTFAVGSDLFHFLLREEHALPYRDIDLAEWGRHEIEEARRELERLTAALPGAPDWRAAITEIKDDHPQPAELISAYRREVERARAFVVERSLVTLARGEALEVEETPEFERSVVPFAAYLPPPQFGTGKGGVFWVTPPAAGMDPEQRLDVLRGHCRARLPITTVHETYPGHHAMFSRLCGLRSAVRRMYTTSVTVEGWALYCEEMMLDQGFTPDPRSRIYQVRDHLWRACRVVLDVGLQVGSMGVQEATRILVEVACLQPTNAAAEALRYTLTPTQPLSYLIGKREIQSLRRDVERARGAHFRLGEFHDQLLAQGCLPASSLRHMLLNSPAPSAGGEPPAGVPATDPERSPVGS
jgi:uncharacterized protein (DUF885 family)